jgi:hypothetical protein
MIMLARIYFAVWLLACLPAWCQETTNTEADKQSEDQSQLQVPPPVSGQAYETSFEGVTESNYLRGGITFTGAYSSNVYFGTTPIGDMSYSVWPTISLDKTTYRTHFTLNYAPGFTVYQRTTSLNQADQNFSADLQYRLSPNLTATLTEGFQKMSNIFNQPNPLAATAVSGGIPLSNVAVVSPIADMITNSSTAQLNYQVGADSMIGGSGNYNTLTYPNPEQVTGLYNSRSAGASFFYSTRIHDRSYLGATYQYQNYLSFQTNLPSTESKIQTIFLFYTLYLNPNWSISIEGGPQHYSSTQGLLPTAAAWQPMTMVSMSWRNERNSFAGSYSRAVSGGGGLSGTFNSNNVAASYNRQVSKDWTAGASASYANYQSLTPMFLYATTNGHLLAGTVSLQRTFQSYMNFQFGYSWTQQSYTDIQSLKNNPNMNRVFVSLNFTFAKPLQ